MGLWEPKGAALWRRGNLGRGAEDTRLLGKVGTAARIEGEALTVYYLSYVQDWLWRLYYGQEDLESWVGLMREDHCGLCLEREALSLDWTTC